MHAAHDVDHLRDVEVGGGAEVRVGEVLLHAPPRFDERQRRSHALAHRLVQVGVEAGRHEVFRRAHERTGDLAELGERLRARDDVEAQGGAEGCLERRQRDLAVALSEVRIADVRRARPATCTGR